MVSHICGIKEKTNEPKLMDTENRLVVARGGGWVVKWVKEGSKSSKFQLSVSYRKLYTAY